MRRLTFWEEELQTQLKRRNSLTVQLWQAGARGDHGAIESLRRCLRINREAITKTVTDYRNTRANLAKLKNPARYF